MKCPDLHRKIMFGNLHLIEMGWEQFVKFLHLALQYLVKWTNLPSLCGAVGNGNDFHVVLHLFVISIKNSF